LAAVPSPTFLERARFTLGMPGERSDRLLSKQLGHADPAITLKVYTHWLPKSGDRPDVAKLDALSESVARSLQIGARAADRRSA
jgi:hypothetical protein